MSGSAGVQRVFSYDKLAENSHKTARAQRTQVARELVDQGILLGLGIQSILDFGCGWGKDVQYYRACGFGADGYDVAAKFGFPRPTRCYDLVCAVHVVNVLPTVDHRLYAVRSAAEFVRPGGYLLLAARSPTAIEAPARAGGWQRYNDGFISDSRKLTFQKGISPSELEHLLKEVALAVTGFGLRLNAQVSQALGRRAEN
jgi:hypothetical protein